MKCYKMLFIGLESVPGEADKWEEEQWVGTASSRNYRGTVIRPFMSCDCETGKTRTKFTICKSSVNKEEWQGGTEESAGDQSGQRHRLPLFWTIFLSIFL